MIPVVKRPWMRRNLAAIAAVSTFLSATLLVIGAALSPSNAAEYYPAPASGAYTVDGRGYGHGHGLSQWGSQGAAMRGLNASQILAFYYPGTVQTGIGNPVIRVQLTATSSGAVRLESTGGGGMNITDAASGAWIAGTAGQYRVVTSGSRQAIQQLSGSTWVPVTLSGGASSYAGPLQFGSLDGVTVFQNDGVARNYRGAIQVARTTAASSVAVNHVYMEDYLKGVVPRESPPSWLPAALQSQAVAARSYSWWDAQTPSTVGPWDICDTTACQVYGGRMYRSAGSSTWRTEEYATTSDAVNSTANIALYYGGAPAFTQFSASNGGESSPGSAPYLAAFTDPYDGVSPNNPNTSWTASLPVATLQAAGGSAIGTFTGLRITSREGRGAWGGYIDTLEIVGTDGTKVVHSPRFGLKSSWWKPRSQNNPFGDINSITIEAGAKARFQGWALDPDTTASTALHVYVDGNWGGAFSADISRPDVGALYPATGNLHGFDFTLSLGQGRRSVCIYAINIGPGDDNTSLGCRSVIAGMPPVGDVNSISVTAGQANITGWAVDPDTASPIAVHAYVNGVYAGQTVADRSRPDIGAAYPDAGPLHGLEMSVALAAGKNTVCLYAIDPEPGSVNPSIGCRTVTLLVEPVGDMHWVVGRATTIDLAGWALDPDVAAPIAVHLYVDGRWGGALTANGVRDDVARAFPGTGNLHGFTASLPAGPGRHEICAYAINQGRGSVNTSLGCRTVEVGVKPTGDLNGVTRTGLTATVTGWALDPQDVTTLDVHIYVNGRWGTAATANGVRNDIGLAFPTSGANHGFSAAVRLGVGSNQICAYAINPISGGTNPLLGCRAVSVPSAAADPIGDVGGASVTGQDVTLQGWAIDPDVPTGPVTAHVYVDGRWSAALVADGSRPDIAAAFPDSGPLHGFTWTRTLAPGRHSICVYAINEGQGTTNTLLGCRTADVP
jgi:SpoIID/LytB domain protein